MSGKEYQRARWAAIRAHGQSVVHFHACRGCGEPIFVAWADTGRSLEWVAFDRNRDEPLPGETYIVTRTKMRVVRNKADRRLPAYWPHDCRNPAFGIGAKAAAAQTREAVVPAS